jgi:hypothetical protein
LPLALDDAAELLLPMPDEALLALLFDPVTLLLLPAKDELLGPAVPEEDKLL